MAKYTVKLSRVVEVIETTEVQVEAFSEAGARERAPERALEDEVEWITDGDTLHQLTGPQVEHVHEILNNRDHVEQLRRTALDAWTYNMPHLAVRCKEKAARIERGEEP